MIDALKPCILAFVLTLSCTLPCLAAKPPMSQAALKSDINFLTSNKLHGRQALTAGDQLAAQWIAVQFARAGLKPAAAGSYLQPVPIIEFVPDEAKSFVSVQRMNKKQLWKKPEIVTAYPQNVDVGGSLVFAGYGITAPDLNYDDYANIDAKGKVVLVFEHEPQETNASSIFNGTGNTIYATTRIKALNAQQHGAVAILIAPEPNRKHLSNEERYQRIGGSASRKVSIPDMVLKDNPLHIPIAIISDKAARKIAGPGISLARLQKAIDVDLKPQSTPIAHTTVALRERIKSRRVAVSYNVAGLLEGRDPVLKKETIIISAHHDHDGMSANQLWPGADDNASGTAGVVSLARAMAMTKHKPQRSILFVVFAAEEEGLLGSFYMTAHPLRPLSTTRAMINFDMIGRNEAPSKQTDGSLAIPRDTSNRLNLIGGHYSPDYAKVVARQNHLVGLTLDHRFDDEYILNTFFRSDQFPFVLRGVPAFWWFTGFHPDYHHTTDTADKINYGKMQKILRLAYLTAYAFADGEKNPRFVGSPGT